MTDHGTAHHAASGHGEHAAHHVIPTAIYYRNFAALMILLVLTLVAEVAEAYFELRDFDRRLEIARSTIGSRRESLQLASDRFEGGLTSELDMRQAEAELRRIEAIVFDLERLIAMKENELSVLLGRSPGAVVRGRPLDEQKRPGDVPAGLPAERSITGP